MKGYYETSALKKINVEEVFHDAARAELSHLAKTKDKREIKKRLEETSGLRAYFPWNWSVRAQYVLFAVIFFIFFRSSFFCFF